METAADYWEKRKDTLYYQVVRVLVARLSKRASSMLDVGSAGCPYLDWYTDVKHRTSIDIKRPYEAPGIKSVRDDFLKWKIRKRYDVVTCLQVVEHVQDPTSFATKLLAAGRIVVVSVPYKWPEGQTASHLHDPVDETKMNLWFGRPPNFSYICTEVVAPVQRLIQVYDEFPDTWSALNRRDGILNDRRASKQSEEGAAAGLGLQQAAEPTT